MFCGRCGATVSEGSAFCSNCGANINAIAQAQAFQAQKQALRQSEMTALEQAIAYFGQKRYLYEAYDRISASVIKYARGAKKSLIIWGAINSVFGALFLLGGSEMRIPALIFLVPGTAMIIGGILMQINNKRKSAYYSNEFFSIASELTDYYNAYPNCPVGAEFSNPEVLQKILSVLKSGRADTVKESINLLITNSKRAEMQATVNSISASLRSIESDAARTGANAGPIAFFAATNFFNR